MLSVHCKCTMKKNWRRIFNYFYFQDTILTLLGLKFPAVTYLHISGLVVSIDGYVGRGCPVRESRLQFGAPLHGRPVRVPARRVVPSVRTVTHPELLPVVKERAPGEGQRQHRQRDRYVRSNRRFFDSTRILVVHLKHQNI